MRIGYCSPFNPLKSGISDFSEELVEALAKHMEVIIFSPVKPSKQEILANFEVHDLGDLKRDGIRNSLDEIVYHIGNNAPCHEQIVQMLDQYPGIVELHDFGLHHLVAEIFTKSQNWNEYINLAEYSHGPKGKKIAEDFVRGNGPAPWDRYPLEMGMNRRVLEKATAVIVHSEFVKQMVLGLFPDIPIANIMLHSLDLVSDPQKWKADCRKRLQMQEDKLIFGSFGFATPSKRIIPILDALKDFREINKEFQYVIVGEVGESISIQSEVSSRNLEENVLVTGFVSLQDFKLYMGACDFCLNLRYPTQGENSGSLHRMLGMGKPVIVTDIGTFSDYPDDVALKVRYDKHEVEDIYNAISLLSGNKKELQKRSKAALDYAETYCDLEKNAKRYAEFFQQVHDHTWQPEYEDTLITRLCELGLTDAKYTEHIYFNISDKHSLER